MLRELACEGWVVHRRHGPACHQFRYPVWMLYADVDRLHLRRSRWLSGRRRFAPLSLRPADYPRPDGAGERGDVRAAINARLQRAGRPAADQVFLLTQPRSWGVLFNPVSFYFCYRQGSLSSLVAEITNTPWDEVHSYVLDASTMAGNQVELTFDKTFHVSPFMPIDMNYRWRVKLDHGAIEIAMRLFRDGEERFFAGLYLQGRPLTEPALRRGALAYAGQNARTLLRIYWQAFRLWRKRAPFHPHPRSVQEVSPT